MIPSTRTRKSKSWIEPPVQRRNKTAFSDDHPGSRIEDLGSGDSVFDGGLDGDVGEVVHRCPESIYLSCLLFDGLSFFLLSVCVFRVRFWFGRVCTGRTVIPVKSPWNLNRKGEKDERNCDEKKAVVWGTTKYPQDHVPWYKLDPIQTSWGTMRGENK